MMGFTFCLQRVQIRVILRENKHIMSKWAYIVGLFLLVFTMKEIEFGSMSSRSAFFYGIGGAFIIFCGYCINKLEARVGQLEEILSEIDIDPDPDDPEKEALDPKQKQKGNLIHFPIPNLKKAD